MWWKDDRGEDKDTIDDTVSEFKRQASPLIERGQVSSVKRLFAKMSADVRMANPDRQMSAFSAMRDALREVYLGPSRKVRRNLLNLNDDERSERWKIW